MPSWEPIDVTPLHPEYPCAHCIVSTAVATVIEAMIGGSEHTRGRDHDAVSAGSDPSFHQLERFHRRGRERSNLCGLPLSNFDRSWAEHGERDRLLHSEDDHAALELTAGGTAKAAGALSRMPWPVARRTRDRRTRPHFR